MFGFGLPELIVLFAGVLPIVLWVIALVDILKNEFSGSNKIIWLIVTTFIPLIGVIAYYFIGTKQRIIKSAA